MFDSLLTFCEKRARKGENFHYRNNFKGDNYRKRLIKQRSKYLIPKIEQSDNFKGSNREKFNIAIAILKNVKFVSTKNYFAFWVHQYYFRRRDCCATRKMIFEIT